MTQVAQEHNSTSVKKSVIGNLVCPSSSFSWRSCYVLYTIGFCDQATLWSSLCDKLKNFAVNILLKLVIKSRIGSHALKMRDYQYKTSPIGYWGKGLIVGWYKVLEFLLLVTTCFDNSEFSGVVTLKSPGGVFAV